MIRPLVAGEQDLLVSETVHRRKDGSEYPAEVHLQLVPSADGAVFLAFINDITERKAAEDRVRAGRRLEAALHRIDTQILEGANLRRCWGPSARRSWSPGTACAGSASRAPGAGCCRSHGRVRRRVYRGHRRPLGRTPGRSGPHGAAIRTGKPFLVRDMSGDPVFARWRDRAVRHGLRSMAAIPLTSGEGKMIGVMNVYADRRDAFGEEEIARLETFARQCSIALLNAQRIERLRDADQRLTFHVDRMPLAYIVWDKEFRVREWNPAAERIFGWKAGRRSGCPRRDHSPGGEGARGSVWSRLVEDGEPGYSLNANVRKDGKVITCEWFNTPLRDAAGNISGVLSMGHDVTEKVELERQLQTAQRMEAVGTLAGGIAHDFNNALTGIFGFAEMLKVQLADNPRALADLDQILRSAERASLLTRQLLTFARRQIIQLANVGMNRVVEDLMKLFSRVVGAHIEIRTSLAKDLPSIRADVGQIEQVVMNLVLNARDAMPGGGRLTIGTGLEHIDAGYVRYHPYMGVGSYVVLTVSDTGIGMDRENPGTGVRSVLHDERAGQGDRAGAGHGVRDRQAAQGVHPPLQRAREGTTFKVYLPPVEAPPDEAVRRAAGVPGRDGNHPSRGGRRAGPDARGAHAEGARLHRPGHPGRPGGGRHLPAAPGPGGPGDPGRGDARLGRKGCVRGAAQGEAGPQGDHHERAGDAEDDSFVLTAGIPFLAKPMGPGALARKVREVLDG